MADPLYDVSCAWHKPYVCEWGRGAGVLPKDDVGQDIYDMFWTRSKTCHEYRDVLCMTSRFCFCCCDITYDVNELLLPLSQWLVDPFDWHCFQTFFSPCHIVIITRRKNIFLNPSNKSYFSGSKKPLYVPIHCMSLYTVCPYTLYVPIHCMSDTLYVPVSGTKYIQNSGGIQRQRILTF